MDFLKELGLENVNPGAGWGPGLRAKKRGNEPLHSINPANEQSIGAISPCSLDDYETLMKNAREAFLRWRKEPAPRRGEVVRRIGLLLREKKDALGSLVTAETGKIKEEGDGEVQEMIDMADFAVGQSRMLYGKTMQSERPEHRLYEQWHPLGVLGVITAFNFPVAVWAWNAFLAAVCGDVVVWKPSHKAPLSAVAVQNMCDQVLGDMGYEGGVFSYFVPESREISEEFTADERVPLISFTGSTPVGNAVGRKVAARFGKSILELSGNNPIIIDETADLALAIPAVAFGAVGTAGQRCTTTRRLMVHESIREEVVARLVRAYSQVKIGDPQDPGNLMGPLIDERAVRDFEKAMEEIRGLGGEILTGGKVLPGPGCFVEPTIVAARNDWPIVQRETFAPILYVIGYREFEEALALHNAASHGLSSALFSTDMRRVELYLSAAGSDCGIANVNIGTSGAEIGGAFGGEKHTGGGREAGSDAWKSYMRRQTNTIHWGSKPALAQGIKFELG